MSASVVVSTPCWCRTWRAAAISRSRFPIFGVSPVRRPVSAKSVISLVRIAGLLGGDYPSAKLADSLSDERHWRSVGMATPPQASFLATRRGKLTLALLCAVGFLDFVDASI